MDAICYAYRRYEKALADGDGKASSVYLHISGEDFSAY
jgi:hypothetical protein